MFDQRTIDLVLLLYTDRDVRENGVYLTTRRGRSIKTKMKFFIDDPLLLNTKMSIMQPPESAEDREGEGKRERDRRGEREGERKRENF